MVPFSAVSFHKYVISFCVGLELFTKKENTLSNICYMIVFAIMSPIGIIIGIAVTNLTTDDSVAYSLAVGSLQAIAAGTLLFVAFFEILQREKSKENVSGMLQLAFVVAGFTLMYLVEFFKKYL